MVASRRSFSAHTGPPSTSAQDRRAVFDPPTPLDHQAKLASRISRCSVTACARRKAPKFQEKSQNQHLAVNAKLEGQSTGRGIVTQAQSPNFVRRRVTSGCRFIERRCQLSGWRLMLGCILPTLSTADVGERSIFMNLIEMPAMGHSEICGSCSADHSTSPNSTSPTFVGGK